MAVPFTEKFVRQAREANREESDNVYHHPREDKVVKKCIDLSCRKPLTNEHKPNNQPKSGSPEKWLEAYIIQLAKRSNNYRNFIIHFLVQTFYIVLRRTYQATLAKSY